MNSQDNNNLNDLLKQASEKTGMDMNNLKNNASNGNIANLVSKMNPKDAARFQEILNNPELAQQMLNSPQAQMLMKKFMK